MSLVALVTCGAALRSVRPGVPTLLCIALVGQRPISFRCPLGQHQQANSIHL